MKKYVSLDKRSKKAQREYYSERRHTWGELNPVTRSVPSGKTYNRKKDKKRIGRELSNEFQADPFFVILSKDMEKILLKLHRSADIIMIRERDMCHAD